MLLTVSHSGSVYQISPVEPFKAILYDYFGISVFVYFIFLYTALSLHMTNSKLRNSDSDIRYGLVKFY